MAEYIEREAALSLVQPDAQEDEKAAVTIATAKKLVRSIVRRTPAADVVPVAYGRWIKDNNSLQTDDYYCCYFDYNCSECGNVVNNRYELPKYCPNCGARMDGGSD